MAALTVTVAEPLVAPFAEKLTPEADVFGAGHDQVRVLVRPANTVVGLAVMVGGTGGGGGGGGGEGGIPQVYGSSAMLGGLQQRRYTP